MSSLSVFDFEGYDVRFVGTIEQPEWVAADICKVLGIKNVSDAVDRLEPYQKGCIVTTDVSSSSRNTITVLTVTEPGLYALIFTSRKDSAKRFQRWVFEEVLPSIRKTGTYTSQNQNLAHQQARVEGKYTRRTLTDAIKGYIERHPQMSPDKKKFLYATTTNQLYMSLFGTNSKALKTTRGVKDLRETMSMKEINAINAVEGIAQRLIDVDDVSPIQAMRQASERALLTKVFVNETLAAMVAFSEAMALASGDDD